jgi:hypothetical protein
MDLNYTPLFAVIVSAVLAFITYLNYRLNKTLNIKNQLHNEKVKIYRDLIKIVVDIIAIMDKGTRVVLSNDTNEKGFELLPSLADEIDDKSRIFHNLMIESYMVVPDHIAKLLKDFSDFIYSGIVTIPKDYLTQLEEMDNKTREMAEALIEAFREDLGTSKLNYKLGRN